jgi:hypothetical protein
VVALNEDEARHLGLLAVGAGLALNGGHGHWSCCATASGRPSPRGWTTRTTTSGWRTCPTSRPTPRPWSPARRCWRSSLAAASSPATSERRAWGSSPGPLWGRRQAPGATGRRSRWRRPPGSSGRAPSRTDLAA